MSSKLSAPPYSPAPARSDADADLRRAADLTAAGRVDEALEHLRGLVVRRPECTTSRRALAELCFESGCVDEAIRHGKALLARRPRSRAALDLLSLAYQRRGDLPRARWFVDALIVVDPLEPGHHYRRALLLEQEGDLGGAARSLHRALDLGADDLLAGEIRLAVRLLDSSQLCQIVQRADEEILFNLALRRDARGAAAASGYCLSSFGLVLLDAAAREMESPTTARHLRGN